MSDQAALNAPQSVNTIELDAKTSSKISHVSLYGSRAEVVRVFKFEAPAGQNTVNITELPNIIQNSLRVEGKGTATIHDVTPTSKYQPGTPSDSPRLKELAAHRQSLNQAMERVKKRLLTLNSYLDHVNTEHTSVEQLRDILNLYEEEAEKLQERMKEIQSELELIINLEKEEYKTHPVIAGRWVYGATIGVFVPEAAALEVILTYAVNNASWSALYDVRVSMNKTNKPVELVYKASITQNTGESWDDVPIILETATPTDNATVPKLDPWRVSVYVPLPPPPPPTRSVQVMARVAPEEMEEDSEEDMGFGLFDDGIAAPLAPMMAVTSALVVSQGNITATFRVPGRTTVPSDGAVHSVTIAKLDLDAVLEWVAVPKKDPRTHLKAQVKNSSDYTLLPGDSSIYLDGSFIARSRVPLVNVQETFDCPLGIDPSIRVTYHPAIHKASQTGGFAFFAEFNKTKSKSYIQRIRIHNSKPVAVSRVHIFDQVPVSEDERIKVSLVSPALVVPGSEEGTLGGIKKIAQLVKVQKGVSAQWHGEHGDEDPTLGKDGKVKWVCELAPQEKHTISLEYELSAPAGVTLVGI